MIRLVTYIGITLSIILPSVKVWAQQASDEVIIASAQSSPNASKETPQDSTSNTTIIEHDNQSLNFSGYIDTYYFGNFNRPNSRNNLGSSGISRGFDRYPGQFQLGMLLTRFSYQHKNAEVVGEIGFGPNMEYASYGSDFRYKWGTVLANSTYTAIMIKQAYINYKPLPKITLTVGQFGTHIGNEFIDAPLNFHYSINNTFNAGIPFYHLGIKGVFAPNEKFSLMAGVVNGTDNINDNNHGKSFIGQLVVIPNNKITIYLNTIQGNEANTRSSGQDTTSYFGILDLIINYKLSDRLNLTGWIMLGSLKGENQGGNYFSTTANWGGANIYAAYKFNELFSLGGRAEYFNNTSGARALLTQGIGTDVKSYTITAVISLAQSHLLIKPEFRLDDFKKMPSQASNEDTQQFMDSNGKYTQNKQATAGIAVIYKF